MCIKKNLFFIMAESIMDFHSFWIRLGYVLKRLVVFITSCAILEFDLSIDESICISKYWNCFFFPVCHQFCSRNQISIYHLFLSISLNAFSNQFISMNFWRHCTFSVHRMAISFQIIIKRYSSLFFENEYYTHTFFFVMKEAVHEIGRNTVLRNFRKCTRYWHKLIIIQK